ncbi:leucine-rich repeat protein [Skeletonema marinoi]|uniref:Leucine-rich repeat protein n=1 Tax=Skeletonema marinoi TaxID=267567 RepID=A0AAD8YIC2_9STRA|nr:leucine-rich repeat protein [Skeletonema marinoi]
MDSDNDDGNSLPSVDEEEEEEWLADLWTIRQNWPDTTELCGRGAFNCIQAMTDEDWEKLGRDISNNTHLNAVTLIRALNDQNMPLLFRGLTRSSSIGMIYFSDNALSVVGARSMVPFLQNASNLTYLGLSQNNLQSEGFNALFQALRDSPIESLNCRRCSIELIEIDNDSIPKHLTFLNLSSNFINADGCPKLLQGREATLSTLCLNHNKIDDDGVGILVDALQNNKSLTTLNLLENDGISTEGQIKLLKLVNDISSIEATLQSNHSLTNLHISMRLFLALEPNTETEAYIKMATEINEGHVSDQEAAGREKCIQTQLNSETKAQLCRLQGVDHSVFSDIDPLHLPEVLSLIGGRHGCEELYLALKASIEKCIQTQLNSETKAQLCRLQGVDHSVFSDIDPLHLPEVLSLIGGRHGCEELYLALKASIMTLFSTMNRERCIQQRREYHAAIAARHRAIAAEHETKVEELDNELATIKEEAAVRSQDNVYSQSNKRRRT